MSLVFLTTAKTTKSATKTKRFLKRNGIPALVRKNDRNRYVVLTYQEYEHQAKALRNSGL